MIGWYTRREASLPFEVSFLNTPQRWKWTLDADWLFFFFLPTEARELSAPPASPSPSLSLGCWNYISRFGIFAFRDRKAALSNFSNMLCYYSCEITNKKYTFWDMTWNELWILLTLNRPPPIFTSKIWGGCASPDEPPLSVGILMMKALPDWPVISLKIAHLFMHITFLISTKLLRAPAIPVL